MPSENDLYVKRSGDRDFEVIDQRYAKPKVKYPILGRTLGYIHVEDDGTYTPRGEYAMFGYDHPATTLAAALQAFIGWD